MLTYQNKQKWSDTKYPFMVLKYPHGIGHLKPWKKGDEEAYCSGKTSSRLLMCLRYAHEINGVVSTSTIK